MPEKKVSTPAADAPAAEGKTRKSTKAPARRGRPPLAPELYVEMGGEQYNITDIIDRAKADYRTTHKVGVQSCKVYVKPEEDAAYYVINKVSGKLELVEQAHRAGTPIISCMGAGNKLDASAFQVADIYETSICPLARVMRRELRKRGISHLKVVYSQEPAMTPSEDMSISCRSHCICPPGAKHKCTERRDIPGSTAFVPSVAGLIIAGEVVKDLSRA